ncbi:hypothetical protein BDN72DRAFT_842023 [Pluteus cervinus]|uniref:Uncharacterized protein n=1 Tax=Pluteus cervinus TaxID=181527 RepID=A0ACD3AQY9_9AGAR|nr:hypothetical protein BDN72DRAFT_842023 [Pluteus cervinus]
MEPGNLYFSKMKMGFLVGSHLPINILPLGLQLHAALHSSPVFLIRIVKRYLSFQSVTPELPPEIIQHILAFADAEDTTKMLYSLLFVCRWFRSDIERLYHTIKFHKPRQIILLQILASYPKLASRVKAFKFHEQSLQAMINLEYLDIGRPQTDEPFFIRCFT